MKIAIRHDNNGIYIDTNLRDDIPYTEPPYNFKMIEVDKEDCEASDFNDDLTFNIDKYNDRKLQEENQKSIPIIQARLDKLTQDFIQVLCGAVFDDIEERKQEFQTLHNELRDLLGKEPRVYKVTESTENEDTDKQEELEN